MLSRLAAMTGAMALAATALLAPGATADPAGSTPYRCGGGQFCVYQGVDFTGTAWVVADLQQGFCYSTPNGEAVRSYTNYGTAEEGYFFPAGDCSGDVSAPVMVNTESADLGFDAYSFLSECVSCVESRHK